MERDLGLEREDWLDRCLGTACVETKLNAYPVADTDTFYIHRILFEGVDPRDERELVVANQRLEREQLDHRKEVAEGYVDRCGDESLLECQL